MTQKRSLVVKVFIPPKASQLSGLNHLTLLAPGEARLSQIRDDCLAKINSKANVPEDDNLHNPRVWCLRLVGSNGQVPKDVTNTGIFMGKLVGLEKLLDEVLQSQTNKTVQKLYFKLEVKRVMHPRRSSALEDVIQMKVSAAQAVISEDIPLDKEQAAPPEIALITSRFDNPPTELLHHVPGRRVLKEGLLQRKTHYGTVVSRHCLLFTDMFVVSQQSGAKKVNGPLEMKQLALLSGTTVTYKKGEKLTLSCPLHKDLTFTAAIKSDLQTWYDLIHAAIEELNNKADFERPSEKTYGKLSGTHTGNATPRRRNRAQTAVHFKDVITLSEFCSAIDTYQVQLQALQNAENDQDKPSVEALMAIFETVSSVYKFQDKTWDEIKERVLVSFVKETQTTHFSLGSGVAMHLLEPGGSIGMLECGSGPIRLMVYNMDQLGIVRLVDDFDLPELSLSALNIEGAHEGQVSVTAMHIAIVDTLEFSKEHDVKLFAVVTGKLSQAWQNAEPAQQSRIECTLADMFKSLHVAPWKKNCFFMSESERPKYELAAASNVLKDISPEYSLMLSFGVWAHDCYWITNSTSVLHPRGMASGKLQGELQKTVMSEFTQREYIAHLQALTKNVDSPVLALHSACLEMFQTKHDLRQCFAVPPRPAVAESQVRFENGQPLIFLHEGQLKKGRVKDYESGKHKLTGVGGDVVLVEPFRTACEARGLLFNVSEMRDETKKKIVVQARKLHMEKKLEGGRYTILNLQYCNLEILIEAQMNELRQSSVTECKIYKLPEFAEAGLLKWEKGAGKKPVIQLHENQLAKVEKKGGKYVVALALDVQGQIKIMESEVERGFAKSCYGYDDRVFVVEGEHEKFTEFYEATVTGVASSGNYQWRVDGGKEREWPNKQNMHRAEAEAGRVFRYREGTLLVFLIKGQGWVDAEVAKYISSNRHLLKVFRQSGVEEKEYDLSSFNHTHRLISMKNYEEAFLGYIEHEGKLVEFLREAVTGKRVRTANQTIKIDGEKNIHNPYSLVKDMQDDLQRAPTQTEHWPRVFMVRGPTGSGKTWFVHQVVQLSSTALQSQTLIPFIVSAKKLVSLVNKNPESVMLECEISLIQYYIQETVVGETRRKFLLQAHRMRSLLVIVDGVDEALEEPPAGEEPWLIRLVITQLRGHCLVLTCSPTGISEEVLESLTREFTVKLSILTVVPCTDEIQRKAIEEALRSDDYYGRVEKLCKLRDEHDRVYQDNVAKESRIFLEKIANMDLMGSGRTYNREMLQRDIKGEVLAINDGAIQSTFLQHMSMDDDLKARLRRLGDEAYEVLWRKIVSNTDAAYRVVEQLLEPLKTAFKQLARSAGMAEEDLSFDALKHPVQFYEEAHRRLTKDESVLATAFVYNLIRCKVTTCKEPVINFLSGLLGAPPSWLKVVKIQNGFARVRLSGTHCRSLVLHLQAMFCAECGLGSCAHPNRTSHGFELCVCDNATVEFQRQVVSDWEAGDDSLDDFILELTKVEPKHGSDAEADAMLNKQMALFKEVQTVPVLLSLWLEVLSLAEKHSKYRLPASLFELFQMTVQERLKSLPDVNGARRALRALAYHNHKNKIETFRLAAAKDHCGSAWNAIDKQIKSGDAPMIRQAVANEYRFFYFVFQEYLYLEERASIGKKDSTSILELLNNSNGYWFLNVIKIASGSPAMQKLLLPDEAVTCENSGLGPTEFDAIASLLKENSTVTSLNAADNDIGDLGMHCVTSLLEVNATLTALNLGNNLIGEAGIASLAEVLKINDKLRELALWRNEFGDIGTATLAAALKDNSALTRLNLEDCAIGPEGGKTIGEALRVNKGLTSLDLSENQLSDVGATNLAGALTANNTLLELNLCCNKIGNEGLKSLAMAMAGSKCLLALDLSHNAIENEGGAHLTAALKENKTLTKLDLRGNEITGQAAEDLAMAILDAKVIQEFGGIRMTDHHPSLVELDLKSMGCGDSEAVVLASVLKVYKSLKVLDFRHNEISVKIAITLASAVVKSKSLKKFGDISLAKLRSNDTTTTRLEFAEAGFGIVDAYVLNAVLKENVSVQTIAMNEEIPVQCLRHDAEVDLSDQGYMAEDAIVIAGLIKSNTVLTHFNLDLNSIGPEGASSLAAVLEASNTLQVLELEGNSIGEGVIALSQALKANESLRSLNLAENQLEPKHVAAVADALQINKGLASLDLSFNHVGKVGASALGVALKANSSLSELELNETKLRDEDVKDFFEALQGNMSLKSLFMASCSLSETAGTYLGQMLMANKTLTVLGLFGNSIGAKGAAAMADGLKDNNSLVELNLLGNKISRAGTQRLAEMLKTNNSLTSVNLGDNAIGDDGALALAEAISVNKVLQSLDVSTNAIEPRGGQALVDASQVHKSLSVLNLKYNGLPARFKELAAKLTSPKIEL